MVDLLIFFSKAWKTYLYLTVAKKCFSEAPQRTDLRLCMLVTLQMFTLFLLNECCQRAVCMCLHSSAHLFWPQTVILVDRPHPYFQISRKFLKTVFTVQFLSTFNIISNLFYIRFWIERKKRDLSECLSCCLPYIESERWPWLSTVS